MMKVVPNPSIQMENFDRQVQSVNCHDNDIYQLELGINVLSKIIFVWKTEVLVDRISVCSVTENWRSMAYTGIYAVVSFICASYYILNR